MKLRWAVWPAREQERSVNRAYGRKKGSRLAISIVELSHRWRDKDRGEESRNRDKRSRNGRKKAEVAGGDARYCGTKAAVGEKEKWEGKEGKNFKIL